MSLELRSRRFSRPVYVAMVVVLAVATQWLAIVSIALVSTSGNAASWWPAAGTGIALSLIYRGPWWHIAVFAGSTGVVANLVFERALHLGLVAASGLIVGVVVFNLIIGPHPAAARLSNVSGFMRFLLASGGAATATALTGGTGFWLFAGAEWPWTVFTLAVSHLAAILLFVPAFLVPLPSRSEIQSWEWGTLSVVLLLAVLLLFAPFQRAPIAALIVPILGLAALRFPAIYATTALVGTGGVASLLTLYGGGPYVEDSGVPLPAVVLQVFFISVSLTITLIAVVSTERRALLVQSAERTALLQSGFIGSQVGTAFVQRTARGTLTVMEANEVALRVLGEGALESLLATAVEGEVREFETDDGRVFQVFIEQVKLGGARRLYAVQFVDVTELVDARRTIERAMEREREVADGLRVLAQEKDDLVAAVSHELRTPITSVLGFAEELSDARDDAERDEYIAIIERNATRLSRMVDNLLDHGRSFADVDATPFSPLAIDQAVRDVCLDVSSTARASAITVTEDLTTGDAEVMADASMLTSVLTNVISNAVKYTPRHGSVEVATSLDGDRVVLTVDDSGPGIPEDERERVFDPFYRASATSATRVPGTGLGLSITRRLVHRLEGTITIDASHLGGTRVTVNLPVAQPAETEG